MGLTWVNFNKSTLSKFYQLEQCACLKMVHVNTLKGGGGAAFWRRGLERARIPALHYAQGMDWIPWKILVNISWLQY